jgi:hypothetical protein
MAPGMRTLTCGHTGVETTGAKTAMTLINVLGSERIAVLSSLRNDGRSRPIHVYSTHMFWTKSS